MKIYTNTTEEQVEYLDEIIDWLKSMKSSINGGESLFTNINDIISEINEGARDLSSKIRLD